MNLNPGQFPTYKSLFPVLGTQTTSIIGNNSNNYINNSTRLLWECAEGHRWEATPKNIKRGPWCHICGSSYKLTISDMRQLAKEHSGTIYYSLTFNY